MGRVVVLVSLLAACGRVSFEPREDAASDAIDSDGIDAPSDRVVIYPMDTLTGGIAPATAGGYDGTCAMCPSVVASPHGGAYSFDGSTSIALPAISSGFVSTAPFTISIWIRPQRDLAIDRTLLAKPYSVTAGDQNVLGATILANTGTVAYESTREGSTYQYLESSSTVDVTDGAWHHVAIRWDGVAKHVTVDGAGAGGLDPWVDSSAPLTLGADWDFGSPAHGFIGELDDLRFYNRALSDLEVGELAGQ
jgi:hypothetical protein